MRFVVTDINIVEPIREYSLAETLDADYESNSSALVTKWQNFVTMNDEDVGSSPTSGRR